MKRDCLVRFHWFYLNLGFRCRPAFGSNGLLVGCMYVRYVWVGHIWKKIRYRTTILTLSSFFTTKSNLEFRSARNTRNTRTRNVRQPSAYCGWILLWFCKQSTNNLCFVDIFNKSFGTRLTKKLWWTWRHEDKTHANSLKIESMQKRADTNFKKLLWFVVGGVFAIWFLCPSHDNSLSKENHAAMESSPLPAHQAASSRKTDVVHFGSSAKTSQSNTSSRCPQ